MIDIDKPLSECTDDELAELWTLGLLKVVDCEPCVLDIEQECHDYP